METVKIKSNWHEFYETHPDNSQFRKSCSQHPSLLKIFNFCEDNNILLTDLPDRKTLPYYNTGHIHKDLKQYPFTEKEVELEKITSEDRDYLYEMGMRGGNESEWFSYLHDLFYVTERTIKIRQLFNKINENEQVYQKLSQSEIDERVESIFQNHLSLDLILTVTDSEGNEKKIRRIGRYFPVMGIDSHEKYNRKTGGKEIGLQIYFSKEVDAQATIERLNWDHYSVTGFKVYRDIPGIEELCFESKPEDHVTIQYYQHGKPILDKPFEFQTVKRYEPLLKKQMKGLKKYKSLVKEIAGTKEPMLDLYTEATERLFKAMLDYNAENYDTPGSYFKVCMQYWGNELCERYSTEKGERYCDPFCKANKELLKELPCQHETIAGCCTDPQKKRRLISRIEHSGGSLDEVDEEGDRLIDYIKDESTTDPESSILAEEKKDAIRALVARDNRLKEIIEKIEAGTKISGLPEKDQRYFRRKREELKSLMEEMKKKK